jgi:hypothetical protein
MENVCPWLFYRYIIDTVFHNAKYVTACKPKSTRYQFKVWYYKERKLR